jgi:hypothetical protein
MLSDSNEALVLFHISLYNLDHVCRCRWLPSPAIAHNRGTGGGISVELHVTSMVYYRPHDREDFCGLFDLTVSIADEMAYLAGGWALRAFGAGVCSECGCHFCPVSTCATLVGQVQKWKMSRSNYFADHRESSRQ